MLLNLRRALWRVNRRIHRLAVIVGLLNKHNLLAHIAYGFNHVACANRISGNNARSLELRAVRALPQLEIRANKKVARIFSRQR